MLLAIVLLIRDVAVFLVPGVSNQNGHSEQGHELQNLLTTDFFFFYIYIYIYNLKYSFCPPTLLLFDSPARGGHNSYTTATGFVLTNSFFLFFSSVV
jgi:hypothetical protein